MCPARMQVELPSHPAMTRPAALAAHMPKPAAFTRQALSGTDTLSSPRHPTLPKAWWHPPEKELRLLCRRQACLEISASPPLLLHDLGLQAELSLRHAQQKLEASQVFWPLEFIFPSSCSKYVFNCVDSAIQAEEMI